METIANSKREFVKLSIAILSAIAVPSGVLAKTEKVQPLNLYNTHIQKSFHPKIFTESGHYDLMGLFEFDKAMMDYRAYKIKRIDLRLVNLVYEIQKYIGFNRRINILSGYRTPETNAYLRRHTYGVAKHSYHIKAEAVDMCIDGMRLSRQRDIIRGINQNGGVGEYPNSGFIHTDVGPKRSWTTLA
jgi:uncharacterized protein YcbK (DUF882 family)